VELANVLFRMETFIANVHLVLQVNVVRHLMCANLTHVNKFKFFLFNFSFILFNKGVNGQCVTQGSTFLCQCPLGFTGQRCEISDPCFNNPCILE